MGKLEVGVRVHLKSEQGVIEDLDAEVFPDEYLDYAGWESIWGRRGKVVLVALHNRQIVGYLVYEWDGKASQLLRVGVLPRYQRQQIGQQLIRDWLNRVSGGPKPRRIWTVVRDDQSTFKSCCRACGLVLESSDDDEAVFVLPPPSGRPAAAKEGRGAIPLSLSRRNRMFPFC